MITFDQIKYKLSPLKRRELFPIADASGVPFTTLTKIWSGKTTNPRIATVEKLIYYFDRK